MAIPLQPPPTIQRDRGKTEQNSETSMRQNDRQTLDTSIALGIVDSEGHTASTHQPIAIRDSDGKTYALPRHCANDVYSFGSKHTHALTETDFRAEEISSTGAGCLAGVQTTARTTGGLIRPNKDPSSNIMVGTASSAALHPHRRQAPGSTQLDTPRLLQAADHRRTTCMVLGGITIIGIVALLAAYTGHDTSHSLGPSAPPRSAGVPEETREGATEVTVSLPEPPPNTAPNNPRVRRQATFQRWKDATFKPLTQLPEETTCFHTWAKRLTWPEKPCPLNHTADYICWVQVELRVQFNAQECVFLIHNHIPHWVLRPHDADQSACQAVALAGGPQHVNISARLPTGVTLHTLRVNTFPNGVRVQTGRRRVLNCVCPHLQPPPHGSLVPTDLSKPAFTDPVQTTIYLHYQWNMTDYATGVCQWADNLWERFLKKPLIALQRHRRRRSAPGIMSALGLGASAANTVALGQEVVQRRAQVSTAADLLQRTHGQMLRMAASSFMLEDAQKVRSLSIVVDAFGDTANIMSEIAARDQMMAQCLYRASRDIEDTRMLLRDLSHHHLPAVLAKEINKQLPEGLRIIPQQNIQLIENPVLEVNKYMLNIGISMIVYTGTPLDNLHEHQYIGHAVGLTTVPEMVPTNGTHVVKSVCLSDVQALICQPPVEWVPIDEWADQTPQSSTGKTWSAMTPMGDICVNTPTLKHADLTCTYDKPGCFTPNNTWQAPHGTLVPPIKVNYNITTIITRPQSLADQELAAQLNATVQELAERVSEQERKHAVILDTHHALTNNIIAHTKILAANAHKLVVQVEQEKWWDLFTINTSPMGIIRLCVAVLICSVPFLWLCNVCLLAFECKIMRQRVTQARSAAPKVTMAQFQQNAVRRNHDIMRASIDLEIDQIQQVKAWILALELPPDAQRLVTAATMPTGCNPHINLTAPDDKAVRDWSALHPRAPGQYVTLQSTEIQFTPKGIALVFDEYIRPLADLFTYDGRVPHCALYIVPGYTAQSLANQVRHNEEKKRRNTTCDTLMQIGAASFACACERSFDGIVNLYITDV